MSQIFICYNRENQEKVKALSDIFVALEHSVWYDTAVGGGQKWWDRILDEILKCDIFVFALSPEAQISKACRTEREYASSLHKRILPIIVAPDVDINLLSSEVSEIQHVDYLQQDRQAFIDLTNSLRMLPAPNPLPDSLPEVPAIPLAYIVRIGGRIETTPKFELSFKDQSELVVQLGEQMQEFHNIRAVRLLIRRLRQREDLYAKVDRMLNALEIDDHPVPGKNPIWKKILIGIGIATIVIATAAIATTQGKHLLQYVSSEIFGF